MAGRRGMGRLPGGTRPSADSRLRWSLPRTAGCARSPVVAAFGARAAPETEDGRARCGSATTTGATVRRRDISCLALPRAGHDLERQRRTLRPSRRRHHRDPAVQRLGQARPARAVALPRAAVLPHVANVLIRYKQAVLGVAWAVLNPVLDDGRLHGRLQQAPGRRRPAATECPTRSSSTPGCCPGNCSRELCRAPGSASSATPTSSPRSTSRASSSRPAPCSAALPDFLISFVCLHRPDGRLRRGPHLARRLPAVPRAARAWSRRSACRCG